MRKILSVLLMSAMLSAFLGTNAQSFSGKDSKVFLKHVDDCFSVMEEKANEMDVRGACILAYIPGDVSKTWISSMHIVGALQNGNANFLGIAYTKAAEMADTFKDSGSGVREALHGEFGYKGGTIKKIDSGYILAVFSGASGEQDLEIATKGLEKLATYF